MKKKILLAWSSGKDSAMALYRLKKDPTFELAGLFTTFRETDRKIPIHEVSLSRIEKQATAIGVPLHAIALPENCPNSIYEERIKAVLLPLKNSGITHLAFGDLFLTEIREYREKQFEPLGFDLVFPLWGENTSTLASEIMNAGIKAVVTAVDTAKLPATFIGKEFNQTFLAHLPEGIDPCGENGEFHTFVYESPNFKTTI